MSLINKLKKEIQDVYIMHPVSFIVMNKETHDKIVDEYFPLTNNITKFIKFMNYDILISEDLKYGEFRIG